MKRITQPKIICASSLAQDVQRLWLNWGNQLICSDAFMMKAPGISGDLKELC
jgi:hypothetical protein